jgi:hypothetical protein
MHANVGWGANVGLTLVRRPSPITIMANRGTGAALA